MSDKIKSWVDLIFKGAVVLGAIGAMYLQTHFASKADVEKILSTLHAQDKQDAVNALRMDNLQAKIIALEMSLERKDERIRKLEAIVR